MVTYCVEYTARLWINAESEEEAVGKANEITNQCKGLEFDYPEVEME